MHPRIHELLGYLDGQRTILRAAFDDVPRELLEWTPAPGRWSVAGVIEHLAIVEARVARRLSERIANARTEGCATEDSCDPVLPTLDLTRTLDRTNRLTAPAPLNPTGLSAEAAWAALERAGESVRQALRSADGLALAAISMEHPFIGWMTLYQYFALVGTHEARHAAQIREIIAAV
jgi:hypothetical protein